MPFSIERWRDSDIIVVRGSGEVAVADNDAMLRALRTACEVRPSSRVILDLSSVDYIPTPAEARTLAENLAALAKPRQCLMAVVARPGAQYGVARMIETLSSIQNVTAAAFASVDEAVAWMHLGEREQ